MALPARVSFRQPSATSGEIRSRPGRVARDRQLAGTSTPSAPSMRSRCSRRSSRIWLEPQPPPKAPAREPVPHHRVDWAASAIRDTPPQATRLGSGLRVGAMLRAGPAWPSTTLSASGRTPTRRLRTPPMNGPGAGYAGQCGGRRTDREDVRAFRARYHGTSGHLRPARAPFRLLRGPFSTPFT